MEENLFVKLERKKIADQVRARRNSLGLTVQEVSEALSIRKATITQIEMGRNVNLNTLLIVVMYLGGQVNIFFKK